MPTAQPKGYTGTQIAIHWIVAALFVFQIVAHDGMEEAWDAIREGTGAAPGVMAYAHIAAGIAIMLFALWRLAIIIQRGAPAKPETKNRATIILAKAVQGVLYLLMFVMPVSGGLAWFMDMRFGIVIHKTLPPVMIAAIVLHVAGAIADKFYFKDGVMERMLRAES